MDAGVYEAAQQAEVRDLWLFVESRGGEPTRLAREMLAGARRLVDEANETDDTDEDVVALALGEEARHVAAECVERGADVVYVAEDEDLEPPRLRTLASIVARAARERSRERGHDLPRHFLFPSTPNGRGLAAAVAAHLDAGLVTDADEVYVDDVEIDHPAKTEGPPRTVERVLHAVRDEPGGRRATLACLDHPFRSFHPQCCSVRPGTFEAGEPDRARLQQGRILDLGVQPREVPDLRIVDREARGERVDLAGAERVVALGPAIGEDPERGLEEGLALADALDAELAVSRGALTADYRVGDDLEGYLSPERELGPRGADLAPELCVAAGLEAAGRTLDELEEARHVCAIAEDPDPRLREAADALVDARPLEVLPRLAEALRRVREGKP